MSAHVDPEVTPLSERGWTEVAAVGAFARVRVQVPFHVRFVLGQVGAMLAGVQSASDRLHCAVLLKGRGTCKGVGGTGG